MANLDLGLCVKEFINTKKDSSIKYLEDLKRASKTLEYEDYLKRCFISYPEHKWHLELKKSNIDAYKKVFLYLKFNFKTLNRMKSFDELLLFLDEMEVKNFGELSVYDVSLCIGASRDLFPERVYLHAGPRKAMKHLLGSRYKRVVKTLGNDGNEYVELEDLPEEFMVLKDRPHLIEDCLCFIWSHYLQ